MREKFEAILNKHGIYDEDVEEILYAVTDMLYCIQDEIKEKEPYATNTIDRLEMAAQEVNDLVDYLQYSLQEKRNNDSNI